MARNQPEVSGHRRRDVRLAGGRGRPGRRAGQEAQQEFARQLETADIGLLAQAFEWNPGRAEGLGKTRPGHSRPPHGNPWTTPGRAGCSRPFARSQSRRHEDSQEPPSLYTEAADLIADRYADSPDIGHFCEGLGFSSNGSQPWAPRFERHLRAILKVNRDRAVRCEAQFALASVVQNAPEDRQEEAETLFEQYCAEFDGKHSTTFKGSSRCSTGWPKTN